jgi:hypothetical protein
LVVPELGVQGEQGSELPIPGEVVRKRSDQLLESLGYWSAVGVDVVVELGCGLVEDINGGRLEHGLLRRKVVEKRRLADMQALGDILDSSLLKAALSKKRHGGVDQGLALPVFLLLAQAHRVPP